jgi:DNA-binding protein HU-beta
VKFNNLTNFAADCLLDEYKSQNRQKPMRKSELVNKISEKTGIPKVDVLVSIEAFCKEIKDALSEGENVYIRGFGSFIVKTRKKKIGRNIKKNVAIEIPEQSIPAFKPAKVFIHKVKGPAKKTAE